MLDDVSGVKFDPDEYVRGFSDAQIAAHLRGVLAIVEELDPPMDLRVHVFGVAQAMRGAMEPRNPQQQVIPVQLAPQMAVPRGNGRRR